MRRSHGREDAPLLLLDGLAGRRRDGMARFGPRQLRVVQVSAGAMHSLLLLESGVVLACGAGTNGELGAGLPLEDAPTPRRVLLPEACRAVCAGSLGARLRRVLAFLGFCVSGGVRVAGPRASAGVRPSSPLRRLPRSRRC